MLNIFNLLQGLVITILIVNIKNKFSMSFFGGQGDFIGTEETFSRLQGDY